MPKRTNVFQEVVAIIQEHMAGEAEVAESALLPHRVTGTPREVDVVIRSQVAGHEIIVSVEATSTGRKADVTWVERLVKKHSDLPTSKLVLVSEAGFTPDARKQAEHDGAVPLAPKDLAEDDSGLAVVSKLPSLWPKTLELKPESATVLVRRPDGTASLVRDLQPDHLLFFEDGRPAAILTEAFRNVYEANLPTFSTTMGLEDIAEDTERFFVFHWGPPCSVEAGGETKHLALRWEQSNPHELHEIQEAELRGKAVISVAEIPLHHKKLGDVAYSYGEGTLGRQPALLVVSEDQGGAKASIRLRSAAAEPNGEAD